MPTDLMARPPAPSAPAMWLGDPLILVYAVRHALTLPAGHITTFVQRAVAGNARGLSTAGRRVIARDVRAWLDDGGQGADATPEERAGWIVTLAVLGES